MSHHKYSLDIVKEEISSSIGVNGKKCYRATDPTSQKLATKHVGPANLVLPVDAGNVGEIRITFNIIVTDEPKQLMEEYFSSIRYMGLANYLLYKSYEGKSKQSYTLSCTIPMSCALDGKIMIKRPNMSTPLSAYKDSWLKLGLQRVGLGFTPTDSTEGVKLNFDLVGVLPSTSSGKSAGVGVETGVEAGKVTANLSRSYQTVYGSPVCSQHYQVHLQPNGAKTQNQLNKKTTGAIVGNIFKPKTTVFNEAEMLDFVYNKISHGLSTNAKKSLARDRDANSRNNVNPEVVIKGFALSGEHPSLAVKRANIVKNLLAEKLNYKKIYIAAIAGTGKPPYDTSVTITLTKT